MESASARASRDSVSVLMRFCGRARPRRVAAPSRNPCFPSRVAMRVARRGVLVLAIAVLGCDTAYSVQGVVRARECRSGGVTELSGAEVTVRVGRRVLAPVVTDVSGRYRILFIGLPFGRTGAAVRYEKLGYEPVEVRLDGISSRGCGKGCWEVDVVLECGSLGGPSISNHSRPRGAPFPHASHLPVGTPSV